MKYIGTITSNDNTLYHASITIKDEDYAVMHFYDSKENTYHDYTYTRKIEDHQTKIFEVDDDTYENILEKLSE